MTDRNDDLTIDNEEILWRAVHPAQVARDEATRLEAAATSHRGSGILPLDLSCICGWKAQPPDLTFQGCQQAKLN